MRTDILSKRLFQAGCFGLPWLWIVHVLYWRGSRQESTEAILNPDDHFPEAEGAPEATPEEIQQEAEKWVQRCQYSAPAAASLWIGWIIASQLLRDQLPAGWFMASFDDSSVTGW
ncbi:predicted protein [Phaeodactylum tricornutum CCAP 1055/1]|uniref:Uncharacterized protein n=2 Tax=Phaeodactylum tricornutum TaxID=2850 RepID=B7FTP1_PHATC|nr:predicted protein [Phaeodactylum tricornutum CCAP 1055/1]EEC50117.1 predicted protein [Phaeodactylum tricornutum CCAP 1055/1]|eukprot:XP_002178452.1 predicted protein [Phaeodactylum tricornutum CCAP 1055/1]